MILSFLIFTLSIGAVASQNVAAYHDDGENFVPPEEWGTIWPGCSAKLQSPIDITVPATGKQYASDDMPLILEMNSCQSVFDADNDEQDTSPKWNFVDQDCTAQGQNAVPHTISHSDIHTPAEHLLNGVRYDAEFHVGFRFLDPAADPPIPNVLVLTFIFEGNNDAAENPLLTKLIEAQQMDSTEDNPINLGNWQEMLGLRSNSTTHGISFFNYIGSGDVPPCLGGIDWWVADTPIEVAQSQIEAIHSYIMTMEKSLNGTNVRPIQELEGRQVRTGDVEISSGAFFGSSFMFAIFVSFFGILLS